jgi:hypothetical protein
MILKNRLFAFCIDYLLIIAYALFLWLISNLLTHYLRITPEISHPVVSQCVGFFTLTLPVFFYFFFSERSRKKGTIGKRKFNIYIDDSNSKWRNAILLRNIFKFLPWEMAHTGVHWIIYYSNNTLATPSWVWMALIIPQAIAIFYITSIFYYKGESSVYDIMAGTRIKQK